MKRVKKLTTPPTFLSYSAVGGYEEGRGPLGHLFDLCDPSDRFGMETFEESEGEMGRRAVNIALGKAGISHTDCDLIVAGDLQNQCVATSGGIFSFGIPFLGVYGACSTLTESLLVCSLAEESGLSGVSLALTSSHNAAAERQFRTPLEYGGQRTPTAQWTATAAGAFILTQDEEKISKKDTAGYAKITHIMAGRIIDGGVTDASNMGGAMSFAAIDSILSFFENSCLSPTEVDYIVTGDLGRVGSDILHEALSRSLPSALQRHVDCGMLLYDKNIQDIHAGASGCGTSAAVMASYFLPKIESGEIKRLLLLSTGALMSPSSVLRGNNILGIAPAVLIEHFPR